jgi:predicted nucleic acid-binding protein
VALVVLDASVVIAFLDGDDALHERAIEAIAGRRADELVIPASAYAETLMLPYRRGPDAVARVERFVQDFAIRIQPVERNIAREAARLRARHPALRLPDALVLAAGDALGADPVLTGERGWAKISRRVRVI